MAGTLLRFNSPKIFEKGVAISLVTAITQTLIGCSTAQLTADGARLPASGSFDIIRQVDLSAEQINTSEYHASMAQAYGTEGNADRAIEEWKLAITYDPKSSHLWTRLANELLKKNDLSQALEAVHQAITLDPKNVDAFVIRGGIYQSTKQNELALIDFDIISKLDPEYEEAYIYKSQILLEQGLQPKAAKVLQQAIKVNSESAMLYYYLGRVHQARGEAGFSDAKKALEMALSLRPGFYQAKLALAYQLEITGNNTRAVELYKEVFYKSNDNIAAQRLSTILLKEEKYRDAVPFLEAMAEQDHDDLNTRVKLGLVYMELKEYQSAIKLFNNILTVNPDADRIHYYLGSLYSETGQTDQAISELRKIPKESKLFQDAILNAAYLLKTSGKPAETLAFIDENIKSDANGPALFLLKASIHEEMGNDQEATVVLESGKTRFPTDEKILYYLGTMYEKSGQMDKGLALMEELLKINPDHADALNFIGYSYASRGIKVKEAEQYIKHAMKIKPDSAYIQDSWGWMLFLDGKYQAAVTQLEKASRMKPDENVILEHLAETYLKLDLKDKALATYSIIVKQLEEGSKRSKILSIVENLKNTLENQNPSLPNGRPAEMEATRIPATKSTRSPASVQD